MMGKMNVGELTNRMKGHLEYMQQEQRRGVRYTDIMAAMKIGIAEMEKINPDFIVFMDGNSWCAVTEDFIDRMESDVGFGDTPGEAVKELEKYMEGRK